MRVRLELFATLTAYLPPGSRDHAAELDVPPGTTVADLARRLGLPDHLSYVVLVNGQDADAGRRLAEGDVVALFPPLAGGARTDSTRLLG